MNNDDESNNVWQQFEQFIQEKILVNSPAKEEQKKKMYLCKYIKLDIPKFDIFFVDNKPKLRLSCLCNNNYELSFEQVFLNYTVDYDIKRNYDDYFFCQLPGHDNNEFECYCEICKKNLCSLCNKKFRVCPHKEDYLFNFNQNYEDYKVFGQSIKNELNKKKNIDPFISKLFDVIYDNFNEYKNNYSYFYIIKNYKEFIFDRKFN